MRCGRVQKRGRQREQSLGRSRGGFSSKIHLLVDALGFPLRFILTGAERHDITQAESLLAPFHFDAVIADKGYDSDPLRILLAAQQVEVVIPSRRNRKRQRDDDQLRYKERNIVERFINRIKWYRRIFTRDEKLAQTLHGILAFCRYPDLASKKCQRLLKYISPQINIEITPTRSRTESKNANDLLEK